MARKSAGNNKKSWLGKLNRHYVFLALVSIVAVAAIILMVVMAAGNGPLAGEAYRFGDTSKTLTYEQPPVAEIQGKDTWTSSELEVELKNLLRDNLGFRKAISGFSCQQVCELEPGTYSTYKLTRQTSECIDVIVANFLSPSSQAVNPVERVLLYSSDETYFDNGYHPFCEQPIFGNAADGTLCLCI